MNKSIKTPKESLIIQKFIDKIGEDEIFKKSLEKIEILHKRFIKEALKTISKAVKHKPELKPNLVKLKKIKVLSKKSIPIEERIDSIKYKSSQIVILAKRYETLSELTCEYNKIVRFENIILNDWNHYERFFDWLLDYGEHSYIATHISKLTHSSSKGSSIDVRYHPQCLKYCDKYLITHIPEFVDTAYPDNKYSIISKLYLEKSQDSYIGDILRKDARKYLKPFTTDNSLLEKWSNRITSYIKNESKQSYFLNKQIYFPVEQGYHLLLPLISSSLVHAIYNEHQKYYSEEATEARRQKKSGLYSPFEVRSYPNKAYLHVTGSNHSNASSLNGQRGGRIALFASMPPQWQSNNINVNNKSTLFDNQLEYRLRDDIHSLRKYLIVLKQQQAENLNKPQRNAIVVRKLKSISDSFFEYLTEIQLKNNTAGWTMDCELSIEQQLLLEPNRTDDIAKTEKLAKTWIKTVSESYARWLNKKLKQNPKKTKQQKKILLNLTPIHERLWQEYFTYELNNYLALITTERLEESNL